MSKMMVCIRSLRSEEHKIIYEETHFYKEDEILFVTTRLENGSGIFTAQYFNESFISLSEWRERQIDDILN